MGNRQAESECNQFGDSRHNYAHRLRDRCALEPGGIKFELGIRFSNNLLYFPAWYQLVGLGNLPRKLLGLHGSC